ncbi:hypothetical protein [Glaciibacter psychrotolerans]|uniref:Uncharacterized protein n=1 Tax=Glaciibacter psychrotolerans TaxID=670054 RepID=A0A7Z0EDB9_9MICO|nr:hypothetical protein [Leifsonia psychrotolerans]NYJ19554.1 hypothetical protein [Leifsonia psychrotolerans]
MNAVLDPDRSICENMAVIGVRDEDVVQFVVDDIARWREAEAAFYTAPRWISVLCDGE